MDSGPDAGAVAADMALPRHINSPFAGRDTLAVPEAVFMPRPFVQATIPHRKPDDLHFQRQNGHLKLTMVGHPDYGLPYGKTPRLLLAWITRQAKRLHTRHIQLPTSQAALIREFGNQSTGGQNGSISTLRDQAMRLATTTVHFDWRTDSTTSWRPYHIASGLHLWWDQSRVHKDKGCWIELDSQFYESILESTIPLDFGMLIALRSPLAIDLYAWLTYRVYRLRRQQIVPWEALQSQLGSDYNQKRDFRRAISRQLGQIHKRWPELRARPEPGGLRLRKCRPHFCPASQSKNGKGFTDAREAF